MHAQTVPPFPLNHNGRRELKGVARKYMLGATIAGSMAWSGIFLLLLAASILFWRSQPIRDPYRIPIDVLPAPPPVDRYIPAPTLPSVRPASPRVGLPVPVPDVAAPPDVISPPAPDLPKAGEPDVGVGAPLAPPPGPTPAAGDLRPSPNAPIYVDELPEVITRVNPVYPELPKDAGVEGVVVVRAYVGKNGRVEEVFVESKFSIPMLNDAACEAVRKWVFKPAFTNNRPVGVWVAIPIRFTLH